MAITATQRTDLVKVAVGLFNAAPGATYLNNFTPFAGDPVGLAKVLAADPAFTALYPAFLTSKEFATKFVDSLVGNAAAAADKAAAVDWLAGELDAGMSRADAMVLAVTELQAAAGDAKWAAAAAQFANKVKVAEYYSVDLGRSQTDVNLLKSVIANVTDKTDVSSAAALLAIVNATSGGAGVIGDTFTLTTASGQNVVGTAGNDTFSAIAGNVKGGGYDAANSTLNLGDQIDGGAGKDTLNLILGDAVTVTGTAAALAVGTVIKNVEVVNINHTNNVLTPPAALTSATFAGVQELWQVDNSAAGAGTFGGVTVAADVTAGFKSTGAAASAVALGARTVNGTTAAQTSVKVALDGVAGATGAGNLITFGTVAGAFQTITVTGSTVNATAANNQLTLVDDTGTKTLNVGLTSNTIVNITDADNSITKVDLSASTGNVTVATNLGGVITGVKTVIGGTGNDTLTVDMGTAVTGFSVKTGAGNDTLNLRVTGAAGDALGTVELGAGKDTLATTVAITNIIAAGANATADELVANLVTVTDFKTSEDVLDLATGTALTGGQLSTINGSASLLAATQAAAAILNGAAGQVVFGYGGDAYVFNEVGVVGVNNGDGLIKLTGVDATLFTNVQNGNLVL